jgi:citrate synthase
MPKRPAPASLARPRKTAKTAKASKTRTTGRTAASRRGPDRGLAAGAENGWQTSITLIEPNKILVRGYPLDELMGRVSFSEAIYLLLVGELPSPAVGRLMEALLVSSIDHGATPPSTLAACNVATTGAPLRAAAAAGVLAFGSPLGGGGSIEACFRFLDEGLGLVGEWVSYDDAARRLVDRWLAEGKTPPGFGHRYHTRDPRAARLMQMMLELELDGRRVQLIRAVERALAERRSTIGDRALPINEDGAIAAVCGDLGMDAETASVLFMISRLPGIVAHAVEEQQRQRPMRQIDPTRHRYDGSRERRLPETRR